MAEGDTILRAARRIEQAVGGEELAVSAPNPRGQAAGVSRLDGREITAIRTHGKHLICELGDLSIHTHLGMSGSWHIYPVGVRWRKPKHLAWVVLGGENREAVQFNGPTVRVLRTRLLARDPKLRALGPDILAADLDIAAVVAKLRQTSPNRGLGDALLDQRLVAGIGNIFKSEGCWRAELDPWRPLSELTDEDLTLAVSASRDLMVAAVTDGRAPKQVYRRARQPCSRCRHPLRSLGQGDANRTTYWCPKCQG